MAPARHRPAPERQQRPRLAARLHDPPLRGAMTEAAATLVHDPVCGMTFPPEKAKATSQDEGETIYFCSPGCKQKFDADPDLYLHEAATPRSRSAAPPTGRAGGRAPSRAQRSEHGWDTHRQAGTTEAAPGRRATAADQRSKSGAAVEWTCPMHPEIVRDQPGSCPICGMALEPMVASLDEGENPELLDMRRRFWISLVLTVPIFISAMGMHLAGHPLERFSTPRERILLELALATPVVLWG